MQNQNIIVSISEIENAFFNHAADAGMIFTDRPLIVDGNLHRVHIDGDKRGTKNGAYILHADGRAAGWFQDFKTGISGTWTANGKRELMNKEMHHQIEDDRKRRQIEQEQRQNDAADKSKFIWTTATPIIEQSEHPYLIKKHIQPHTARLYKDALVVPIYDEHRMLVNVQLIQPDGTKRFLSNSRKKGCFSVMGRPDIGDIILICEGWATACSLREATGHFIVVALDAGNLMSVAKVLRRLYSNRQIILMGDNDLSGTGQKAAQAAALAVGGKYYIPANIGLDWNDVMTAEVL